jgi:2-dehydro-3-deoxyphosphogalactonate aldolase
VTLEEALAESPIVAIMRGVRPDEVMAHAEALHAAGVRVVEVPLNSPEPLESIRALSAFKGRMVFGAGTVLTPERVDAVAEAGGEIIVSPNTDPLVIRRAVERGLPALPGFSTATEAFAAIGAGARHLKLFPASSVGSGHLKALKAVLPPEVQVHAVGGVSPAAFAEWRAAGAAGFGMGSELYKPGQTSGETAAKARAVVAAARALA